ncbi:MAG TPA: ribosome biogenesis GTP-binding protein YihA/YsxC [Terriglobales bacterium]|nr:ribosome biogenesis GTP-binding protein YihA/YsxC [Terriglobales bacterium]
MRILSRLTMAATEVRHFPVPTLPEIAFLGRSNVGKSSVINSLVGKKLARTSSIPGRTRSINFFELRWPGQPRAELVFTDLPGYGYARLPREISARWPEFIEPYLKRRPCLVLCVALVDVTVPPQESDRHLLEFLASIERPFVILGTKSDRLSGNSLSQALKSLGREFPQAKILPYSARTGAGRDELWREIRHAALLHQTHSAAARQSS